MSFFYICSDCGRGFTTEDISKVGIWNKMFKPAWRANGPQAGAYAANPTCRCPYCLSRRQTAGTEEQRGAYLKEKRSYPAPDPRWPSVLAAQKYEDCEINLDIAERKIRGLSADASQRLQKAMDECGWTLTEETLKALTKDFFRGIICLRPAERTWYVYRKQAVFCAVRCGEAEHDYLFSADGKAFIPGPEAERKLLKKVNEAICDYSFAVRGDL